MKQLFLISLLTMGLNGWCNANSADAIRSVRELNAALTNKCAQGSGFDLTVQAVFPSRAYRTWFSVRDGTGITSLADKIEGVRPLVQDGDIIRVIGSVEPAGPTQPDPQKPHANCYAISVISSGTLPPPQRVTAKQVVAGTDLADRVTIDGVIRDAVRDEIDPRYVFFSFYSEGETFYFPSLCSSNELNRAESLIGSHVSVSGFPSAGSSPSPGSRQAGRTILTRLDLIKPLDPPSSNYFDVPGVDSIRSLRPSQIAALGRHRLTGHVIAVWQKRKLLLKTESGHITCVDLLHADPPAYGQWIDVSGIPESDLYHINLSRARWQPAKPRTVAAEPEIAVSAKEILYDDKQQLHIRPVFHGKTIQITGVIRSIPPRDGPQTHFLLDCDNVVIPVDFSTLDDVCDKLVIGCTVRVRGTCVMETENWRLSATFPQIKGFFVVLQAAEDVQILQRPPWWTPAKFAAIVGILLVIIAGILIWNATLRVMVSRKSHALFKEQIAKLAETLKIVERTRLAAELHDYLAQNLTVVAYQVSAVQDSLGDKDPETGNLLRAAVKMLQSCRTELRRCLWDLRSNILDESDFAIAIRRASEPVAGRTKLTVQFQGCRAHISDTTAHALLSILRELVANAANHGHAQEIRIIGGCRNGGIYFSVHDDGLGFDPDHRPGQDDGHFGLDGVRERLERLNGTMSIRSAQNGGTHIRIEIKT